MKLSLKKHLAFMPGLGISALLAGCGEPKTVYVDDYRELRPYATTVLSETQPSSSSPPDAAHASDGDETAQASASGG